MSEFENINTTENNEELISETNPGDAKDTEPIPEVPDTKTSADYKPAFDSGSKEAKGFILDASLIKKKLVPAVIVLAAIIILVLIIKGVSGPHEDKNNLFTNDMLVFNEINVENQAIMYGVIDKKAKLIVDADYSLAFLPGENIISAQEPPVGDDLFVHNPSGFGLINKKGDEITKFSFNDCGVSFSEGLLPMAEGGKWGFVNTKGEWEISPNYAGAYSFSEGLAAIKDEKSRKWGFVDTKGKWIIEAVYEDAGSFTDGLAPVKKNGKWGFINKNGKLVIDNDFKDVGTFIDGIARAQDVSGDWGYINKKGKWVIKASFQEINTFSDGLAAAKKNGEWGFVNKKGDWKIHNNFSSVGNFVDGLAYAQEKTGEKYGYINKKGQWKLDPEFDVAYDFTNGLACVKKSGKYGYINKKGKTKIDFDYKYAVPFYDDGYAAVCKGNAKNSDEDKWFVIDTKGKAIFEDTFDGISR